MNGKNGVKATVMLVALFSSACGESGDSGGSPTGSGGDAGSGASATGGTAATGTGGGAGASGCPTTPQFGPGDVDVTLGGLNADLPAPSMDCLTVDPAVSMCAALSAIVNGVPQEILCTNPNNSSIDGKSMSCDTASGGNVAITASNLAGTPPTTFSVMWTDHSLFGPIQVALDEGTFKTDMPSFVEARQAGWVNKFVSSGACRDTFHGVVAASWSDAGMGETRLRGSFHSRTF
jgi:hypothetical protein